MRLPENPPTVAPVPDCRVPLSVPLSVPLGDDSIPASCSAAEFVKRLEARSLNPRNWPGYDLGFDADGAVVRLQSLCTP
ncbi:MULTISPECIES: hypothetical protein [unclassified Streptomyces]|uniref:hypothetical protein n=1 Tax=unclassified Streptomyces TaxID=2593676 RepID=UPI00381F6DE3